MLLVFGRRRTAILLAASCAVSVSHPQAKPPRPPNPQCMYHFFASSIDWRPSRDSIGSGAVPSQSRAQLSSGGWLVAHTCALACQNRQSEPALPADGRVGWFSCLCSRQNRLSALLCSFTRVLSRCAASLWRNACPHPETHAPTSPAKITHTGKVPSRVWTWLGSCIRMNARQTSWLA